MFNPGDPGSLQPGFISLISIQTVSFYKKEKKNCFIVEAEFKMLHNI